MKKGKGNIDSIITAAEIRDVLEECYPEVTDPEFSLEHSGVAHEHPLIAVGVVLISSIVLGTTSPARLVEYTRYSDRFVQAVAGNMRISGLWRDDQYDCSHWQCGQVMPPRESRAFWDHVLIGEGSLRMSGTRSQVTVDSGLVFWRDKLN